LFVFVFVVFYKVTNNFIIAKNKSKLTYSIHKTRKANVCKVLDNYTVLLEFNDTITDLEKGNFVRTVKKHTFDFEINKLIKKKLFSEKWITWKPR